VDNDGNALVAGALYFDSTAGAMKVYTGSAWVAAYVSGTSYLPLVGGTMTGNISFGDNDKAIFGAGSDLQIYHDGSHSYISDQGTGNLRILAGEFNVKSASGNTDLIYAVNGGSVYLYYNGNTRITTNATGTDFVGTVTADGLTVDGTNDVALITTNQSNYTEGLTLRNTANWGYGTSLSFEAITSSGGSNAEVGRITSTWNTTGYHGLDFYTLNNNTLLRHMRLEGDGDFALYEDTGTTAKFFWDASEEKLLLGSNNVSFSGNLGLDSSSNFVINGYPNNSIKINAKPNAVNEGVILQYNGTDGLILNNAGNVGIGTSSPSAPLHLFGNNTSIVIQDDQSDVLRLAAGTEGAYIQSGASLTSGSANPLIFGSIYAADEWMRITSNGNVGIGTSSPAAPLEVSTSSADYRIQLTHTFGQNKIKSLDGDQSTFRNLSFDAAQHMFETSGTERMRIDSSGNVGIGVTNPTDFYANRLVVSAGYADGITIAANNTTDVNFLTFDDVGSASTIGKGWLGYYHNGDALAFGSNGSERMRIDSSGNVGIGESSPQGRLHLKKTDTGNSPQNPAGNQLVIENGDSSGSADIQFLSASNGYNHIFFGDAADANVGVLLYDHTNNSMQFQVNASERMRIDSSGNLLVGMSSYSSSSAGTTMQSGLLTSARSGNIAAYFNRLSSDGSIVSFAKDGSTVGSIGVRTGTFGYLYWGSGATGLISTAGFNSITPCDPSNSGTDRDNAIDLGATSARFDDIYATNGTIQTSDRNEKQDIAELSDAEQRVAVAAKGLLRKFRWKDAVAEKGDEARTHFGIIAQDLQAAFAAEGLDAGDYAMFIHTTWTDEETSEERSRMGVRYSELLAFIIAAI
jgi:hypothetical protein